MQGGSNSFGRSILLETYRVAKELVSESNNILRFGYDIAFRAI
jgi:hypothetical protein